MKRLVLALTLTAAAATSLVAQSPSGPRGLCRDKDVQAFLAEAKTGNRDAMWCVGVKYANGSQVPKDDVQATVWFRKAADAGHPASMFLVGVAFWSGRGETQDFIEAYKWLDLAARYGYTSAPGSRDSLARVMSTQMINEAKSRVSEWDSAFQKRKKS